MERFHNQAIIDLLQVFKVARVGLRNEELQEHFFEIAAWPKLVQNINLMIIAGNGFVNILGVVSRRQ